MRHWIWTEILDSQFTSSVPPVPIASYRYVREYRTWRKSNIEIWPVRGRATAAGVAHTGSTKYINCRGLYASRRARSRRASTFVLDRRFAFAFPKVSVRALCTNLFVPLRASSRADILRQRKISTQKNEKKSSSE